MPRHPSTPSYYSAGDVPALVRLWLLRLLMPLGCHREFIGQHGFQDDNLAEIVGLGAWVDSSSRDYDSKLARVELKRTYRDTVHKLRNAKPPAELAANVRRLARLVGLSATDCRVLEFAVLIHSERLLDEAADWLGSISSVKVYRALSLLLDIPESDIRASLCAQGILTRSGLVSVDRNGISTLRGKLDLLSECFADLMLSQASDPVALLKDTVAPSSPPILTIADYDHIEQSLNLLRPYLREARKERRHGVNVFLYGESGTGKSQLGRVLARELGCELFEVASEDEDGDPVGGSRRLRAFRAAQSFFAQRRALILFDEVEDVFNDGDLLFGRRSTAQTRKAWINRALEENPVPTLWLSNSVQCLDPAFIRRFDMVIEVPVPSRRQRERIVRAACGDMLPEHAARRIAEAEALAPAVIDRAAKVTRAIRGELRANQVAGAIEHLVNSTLEAQGHASLKRDDINRLPDFYDPAFINVSADLATIAAGLERARCGRLCLYGPPGTGKTAFGRWLAAKLDVDLHVKRASDLLSMWVGGTEQNIARAFRDAEQDGALLVLDEVDSFLQDRRAPRHSWEVTAVNEMLTRMESFPGVFIATTNLMQGLDQAAFRRFDLKAKFDYLRAGQAWALLERQCAALSLRAPDAALRAQVARLAVLTPGDFAAVARQHRFRPIESAAALVCALEQECAMKEDHLGAMGFI